MDNISGNASMGDRIRTAFGPILVGLIGGALIGSALFTDTLWFIASETEAHFPNQTQGNSPFEIPMGILGLFLRYGTPLVIGLVTAWFVRTRDWFEDITAGTIAGITASFVAFIGLIGWQATIAYSVTPLIREQTIITAAANPSDAPKDPNQFQIPTINEAYPGIENVPQSQRGGLLLAKLVSSQVRGMQKGLLAGGILSLLMVGGVTLMGTFAGGHLRRKHVRGWRFVGLYTEMMIPAWMTLTSYGRLMGFEFSASEWTFNAVITLSWAAWFTLTFIGAPLIQRASIGLFWLLLLLMHDRLEVPALLTLAAFMSIALASMRKRREPKDDETLKLAIS